MRPDDNNDQGHEEGLSEESALTPIDYSLLSNRSVGAEYVFERSASATGKGVGKCWATLKNRNQIRLVSWVAFEPLKSAYTPPISYLLQHRSHTSLLHHPSV